MQKNNTGSTKGSPPATLDSSSGMIQRLVALLPKRVMPMALAVVVAGLFAVSAAQATIIPTGDVEPDPSTWTGSTSGYVGNTANGTLTVNGGSSLQSGASYLGYTSGVTGNASVAGSGSTWNGGSFYVGNSGTGTLSISSGGVVQGNWIYVGYNANSTGLVTVDGIGSKFYNPNSPNYYTYIGYSGTGTLSLTNGATFNTPSTGTAFIGYNTGSNGTVIVSGPGSGFTTANFDVGDDGNGMLQITNGGAVSTSNGYVGVYGNGNVLVDGTGSHWNTSSIVMDRYTGSSGSLTITNGGAVTSGSVLAGFYVAGASGVIKVDGTGSILTTTGSGGMMVGRTGYGTATMSITDGGAVTGAKISIGSGSLLTTDVSSSLTLGSGTGTLTNAGTVRLVAGAGAGAGTYTPISAGTWTNTGTIQALGGVLNSNNTVTVNAAALTTTSTVANFDLSTTQRVLVTDLASGKSVGAGFQAAPASTPINFGASLVNSGEQSSLQSLLSNGQSVLSAWTFTTSASVSNTNPVYLSLFAGAGHSLNNDLEIWEFNGTSWSSFAANDLAYDGTYASFTTTALEDFAVTGEATPTPIPGALLLFGPGLAGLGLIRKRVFKA